MSLGGSDLNLLNALKALLEEANVTHAGQRLNMTQPAMSGALSRLRRQFDDELLVRNGRDHELTPLAHELLPSVQDSIRLINEAFQLGPRFDPATSTRVFRIVASDYAMSVIHAPLQRRIRACGSPVRVEFTDLPEDVRASDRVILDHDVLVGPLGYGFPGVSRPFFRDRIVCLADRRNPRLVDGRLSTEDLNTLPHAVATFGRRNLTPIDRVLGEHGVERHVRLAVTGWLALPFVIAGTDMVAMVPERLARHFLPHSSLVQVDAPVGDVDLVEGYWFQEAKSVEPSHRWLLEILHQVSEDLEKTVPGPAHTA